jgi:hypothetical protein
MSEPGLGDLRAKSDLELFSLMKGPGRMSPHGKAAFGELHDRYAVGVRQHVAAKYGLIIRCEDDLNEFVQQVFVRFWKNSLPVFDPSKAETETDLPKLIKSWMADAALRVKQHWNEKKFPITATRAGIEPEETVGSTYKNVLAAIASKEDTSSPERKEIERRFEAGLSCLAIRERDVLLSCYRYFDAEHGECRVEASVREQICKDLGFNNWAAVRKCKERAEKRLREALLKQAKVA